MLLIAISSDFGSKQYLSFQRVSTITASTAINSIYFERFVENVKMITSYNTLNDGNYLHQLSHRTAIQAFMRAAVLLRCQGVEVMTIDIHGNSVEALCSMTTWSLRHDVPEKLFCIIKETLVDKRICLQIFVMVNSALNALFCMVHELHDELCCLGPDMK